MNTHEAANVSHRISICICGRWYEKYTRNLRQNMVSFERRKKKVNSSVTLRDYTTTIPQLPHLKMVIKISLKLCQH